MVLCGVLNTQMSSRKIKGAQAALSRMQQKRDFHRIIGENDTPFVRAGEYAGIQQCRHIAVNSLDITPGTAPAIRCNCLVR